MSKTTWMVGINPVEGALSHDADRVRELRVERGARNPRVAELAARARSLGIAVTECARDQLERVADGARHQGVAASYAAPEALDERDLDKLVEAAGGQALFLVLDGVTDPHNLGACLRVADAAGCHAVIAPKDRAVGLSAAVIKVASGAADSVPYIAVTNLARTLRELKERNIWVVGADSSASEDIYSAELPASLAWVLGAEGEGLRRLTRETCDQLVKIPMLGQVESLNVSVASGVVLFESRRRRLSKT